MSQRKNIQKVQVRKDGNIVERVLDPITFSLYVSILNWSIDSNNVFLWFWTLYQWNCMARCASVDPLGFHNFKIRNYSIIVKCDDTKCDKDGKSLSEKNIYANINDYHIWFWD